MIDRFEKFSSTISEIYRNWHKLASDVMEKHGLKGPHSVYLTTMCRYPEGITAVELAEATARDKADVSRAIARFEKEKLVEKVAVNNNHYRARIKLTEEGRSIAEDIITKASAAVELGGKGLTDVDRNTFYDALELISTNLRILAEEGL